MRGTIRERGAGRLQVQLKIPTGPGRYRQVARTVRGGKAEALEVLADLASRHGVDLEPPSHGPQSGRGPRPYPLAPLVAAVGGRISMLAAATGQHPRQLYRWAESGLTEDQADDLAIAAGYHPAEVWAGW